ncbi:hypothetical protein GN958_ATG02073 [Phytophthora infestans]|uniref:Uncharacterized protein n=1 Tax=Phytophthora infestans TaxID=4787 RepID=A0A8S9V969_PHYIN|nr:hypothetical protein GN958_ATG02073 [Phytophthora infestans]
MEGGYYVQVALRSMAKHIQPVSETSIDEVKQPDRRWARRAVPRDAAIVLALHMTFNEAVHVHDPVDPNEAGRIFAYSVKGLVDQMLMPILTSVEHVLQDGDLSLQRDAKPVAPTNDRHASKLIKKRIKHRKQFFSAEKTTTYGAYAASRASSRTGSRIGSRLGGSKVSPSARKGHKMSLGFGPNSGDFMNTSWIESPESNNNSPWLSSSSLVVNTARGAVDYVEMQRRADIERDLSTRESVRRSNDEINRKSDVRIKLRSLADPTISLEKEEAMIAALGAEAQRSRLRQSRKGTRGKAPGIPPPTLSPLSGTRVGTKGANLSPLDSNETMTFRTEDYEGLSSDVSHKLRQELLYDLHTRGVIQPRIKLAAIPKTEEDVKIGKHSAVTKQIRSPTRLRSPLLNHGPNISGFNDQIGSFESSASPMFNFQGVPLAKGVALKPPDASLTQPSNGQNAAQPKAPKKNFTPESLPTTKLETNLSPLIKAPGGNKSALLGDSSLQAQNTRPTDVSLVASVQSSRTLKLERSVGSPVQVLPKHVHNDEKQLQNLRIRTPACPNRLSHKTPSFMGSDGDAETLFSLHEVSLHFLTEGIFEFLY